MTYVICISIDSDGKRLVTGYSKVGTDTEIRSIKITHGDKKRRRTAIVAITHYLARVMLAMLRRGLVNYL